METENLIRLAKKGMDGKHPTCDFPIQNDTEHAVGYALLALVDQQQRTNVQLAGINSTLSRIAKELEQRPQSAQTVPPAEPQRRRWFASRRNA
jgi:hypothetical protein